MSQESLYFVDGVYQRFRSLPPEHDAIYFHKPNKPGLIYIDLDFASSLDIQALFRRVLLERFNKIKRESSWALLNDLYFSTTAAALGIPNPCAIKALPQPDENRLLGYDDTPIWSVSSKVKN